MIGEAASFLMKASEGSKGGLAQSNSTYLPQIASINEVWNIGYGGEIDSVQKNPVTIPSRPITGIPKQNLQYQYPGSLESFSEESIGSYLPILGVGLVAILLFKRK